MNSLFTRIAVLLAFITVSFGVNAQSISSNLNNRPGVVVNVEESFVVSLSPGATPPTTNVKLAIILATPAQSSNINLSFQNPLTTLYENLVFDGSGNSISAPAQYFFFSSLNAKVTFTAPGVYNYTLQILNGTTNAVMASSVESVTVNALPTISSTLNGQTLTTGVQTQYGVSTTSGVQTGTLVKVFFKMNPAQVGNATLEYFEIQNSTWQPFPVNVNGEANFGPASGFPFGNNTTQFRVTYNTPGVYNYKLSVYRAAAPNDTLATANETVTVVNPVSPTIFSSVAGDTLTTGIQTPYSVSTTTGGYAGTMVRVFFKMSPSQVANGVTEYFEPQLNAWVPFTVNGNGEAIFGATAGFPLAATSSQFRVTYNTPGVYNYKMAILRASNLTDTLAIANEFVVVADPALPTISSDLNGQTVVVNTQTEYAVSTIANDYTGTLVKVFFKAGNVAQVPNYDIEYFETANNTWIPLTLTPNGELDFGPGIGFPLADASTDFRITFDAVGIYPYKLSLYEVASGDTLATANESVTVVNYIAPTVESTLDGLTIFTSDETLYNVETVANSELNTIVRGFFKLTNPAQANDVNISYETAPSSGIFLPLAIDINGIGYFGPGTGFPLTDASTNFKVVFDAAGVYDYKIAVYEVATNDTLASNLESVTVIDYVAPTVESTLDGLTVFTSDETLYNVETVANSELNTIVRGFFKLTNPAQANDVNISYETAPGSGVFLPLAIDINGIGYFGPVSGFALTDASTNFKVIFDAAGTYDYKIAVYEVATNDTLASNMESVTVVDAQLPTISSDLNGLTINTNTQTDYSVTTVANDYAGTFVKVFFKAGNAAQVPNYDIEYFETSNNTWIPLTLTPNGELDFGPVAGFPLADASTDFRITFDAVGVYPYKLSLYEVATGDTLATANESVTVLDPTPIVPEISSDLDGRANVVIETEESFTVTTVKNNAPNANVRIKFTLDNAAQANDVSLVFDNPVTSNLEQLSFDLNGVAYAGAATGFPLANDDYDFKVTFFAGGTFEYTVALENVVGNTILASNDESVFVLDDSGIEDVNSAILNAYPNPTTGTLNIHTKGNGLGTLDVFTVTGQKVMSQSITGSLHTISLQTLTSGMYLVKITQDGVESVIRIVKK